MTRHPLWQNLFRTRTDRLTESVRLWRTTPLLAGISGRKARQLVADMHHRHYEPGEYIFRQGDVGAGAVMIRSGQVEIRAGVRVLAELAPGDFFGEVALVSEETRTADAVATAPTELMFLMRSNLDEWVQRSPRAGGDFMRNLAHVLAERLRLTNQQLSEQGIHAS